MKLQDIKDASMRKIKFYSDKNKPSLQKKENSVSWYNNGCKEAKMLRKQFIHAFGTLVTPIFELEYSIYIAWRSKGLERLGKTNPCFYKFISGAKQSTTDG